MSVTPNLSWNRLIPVQVSNKITERAEAQSYRAPPKRSDMEIAIEMAREISLMDVEDPSAQQ